MRVQCIVNDIGKLKDITIKNRLVKSINLELRDDSLVIGQSYDVLALSYWNDGGIKVYLHTIEENDYPLPYPLEMFNVIDQTIPIGWSVGFEQHQNGMSIKQISFPEWIYDDSFYEKLVEGDQIAIEIYNCQRDKSR